MFMQNIDIDVMFQTVLDSLPLFIFWKDRNCIYLGCNQAFADAAGLSGPEDIIGKSDRELIWADQADHFQGDDRFVMDNDRAKLNIVEEQIQPDGMHWVETNKIPIKNKKGEVIGVLGSFHDITDKVKLQEERIEKEKIDTVTALAGGISHDLNNSLCIVSGLVQICQRDFGDTGEERDLGHFPAYLKKMREGIQKSTLLAKRFMNFSREQSAEIEEKIDLNNFFDDTLSLLRSGFSMKIDYESESGLPYILFDESQLSQVINNLILNAKQSMDDLGKVRVSVTRQAIEANPNINDGNYIRVDITDHGHGISEENLANIFKSSFTTKQTGNGLGLASCLAIMKKHGGGIEVSSVLGVGTTFSIYIPEISNIAEVKEDSFVFTKEMVEGTGNIILVDDDFNLRATTKLQLEDLGYRVKDFASGEELFNDQESIEHSDLVITDYYLLENQLNGDEICMKVKEGRGNLPVVLLSGYFKNSEELNNYDYIMRKPFNLARLSQVIDRHILK